MFPRSHFNFLSDTCQHELCTKVKSQEEVGSGLTARQTDPCDVNNTESSLTQTEPHPNMS